MPVIPPYNEQKAREHFIFRMFPKTFLLLFAILICGDLFGKNHEKRITATEEILMNNEFVSIRTYQEMAMEQAINKALDQAFGSTVIDNYEHISGTISKGHHSVNSFQELSNNYINTFPNGRWVKSVKAPSYQQYKDDKGN
ncbi:MAG: hypothetical protein JXR78_03735, partial [Victivallales bacterium]|nr:hypothetical protein [Victivallales bacterium]